MELKKDCQPHQQNASSARANMPLSSRIGGVAGVIMQGQAPIVQSTDALDSTFDLRTFH